MRRTLLACLFLASLATPGLSHQARADQKDPRLPGLFDQLKAVQTVDGAAEIEAKIWALWLKSGSAEIDRVLGHGAAAMTSGDFKTALADFNLIVKKKPHFAEGWNKRATLYYAMGDYKKSLADIDRTLKLEPRHIGAISGQGLIYAEMQRWEDSARSYRHVLDIDPMNASARENYEELGDLIKKKSI